MKVDRKALMGAIKAVAPITETRNTIPILSHMLMQAIGGSLRIQTTDLDMTATTSLPMTGPGFDTALGNMNGLYALLKAADDTEVSMAVEVTGGKIGIGCGEMSASVHHLPADDWPVTPRQRKDWTATAGSDFMRALARVSIAMSTEETRYYLNGAYFHHVADWTYRLVCTDGHRLVYSNVELPDAQGNGLIHPFGQIIPRKMIKHMLRLHGLDRVSPVKLALGPCMLNEEGNPLEGGGMVRLSTEIGDTQLVSKLIDGTFPDYTRVIPAEDKGAHRAKVKTADIRRAVGALMGFSTERTRAIKMTFGAGMLNLSLRSPEHGEAGINIDAETVGGSYEIGFNGRYLLDMATATGGEFMLMAAEGASAPCRMTDPDATDMVAVQMPMRV